MNTGKAGLGFLTGAAFVVVGIVSFLIGGEPKSADDPVKDIVSFYVDNKDSIQIGAFMGVAAGLLLIFFAAQLREVLRGAADGSEMLAHVSFIGLTIVAVGFAIDGTILFALAEAADDIDPTAVQGLQALWDNDFLPIMLGVLCFLWATGIAVIRTRVLPVWMGWLMVLLGIVGLTPIGFAAAIGSALLVLVISVMLALRGRPAPPATVD